MTNSRYHEVIYLRAKPSAGCYDVARHWLGQQIPDGDPILEWARRQIWDQVVRSAAVPLIKEKFM